MIPLKGGGSPTPRVRICCCGIRISQKTPEFSPGCCPLLYPSFFLSQSPSSHNWSHFHGNKGGIKDLFPTSLPTAGDGMRWVSPHKSWNSLWMLSQQMGVHWKWKPFHPWNSVRIGILCTCTWSQGWTFPVPSASNQHWNGFLLFQGQLQRDSTFFSGILLKKIGKTAAAPAVFFHVEIPYFIFLCFNYHF